MLASILLLALGMGDPEPADLEFFEKEVRPILVKRCLDCHGPAKQKGDLRLDSREAALKGGKSGPAVVPGKPDESVLVEAINYSDVVQMPPKSKLPPAEIAALTKWVGRGAAWPAEAAKTTAPTSKVKPFDLKERAKHWSFQPIRRVEPPKVKDAAWPESDIDRFLLAPLENKGLKPAREADRRTLIRRATFDLIGLPPTPEEIDTFLNDKSPNAFATIVDRLLASPAYGERWGRHWLDLMRYAETSGHEFDYDIPDAWRYRDYVIRAFNDDLPYDRFLTEHVAGDLLADPRRNRKDGSNESILATGFYFLGEGTHSPVDVRDDEILRIDNQIDVLSKTFLGLTVSCARCHDHKFDAIGTKDYYALAGFFKSSRFQHAIIDAPDVIAAKVARLEAIKSEMGDPAGVNVDDSTFAYLKTARNLIANPGTAADDDIVFDDFEGDVYAHWTSEGRAFGDGPIHLPVPEYQGHVGAHGRGLVGSHNGRWNGDVTERDALIGTLTSKEFPIERDFIHFLIGGGSHAGKTCVNLLIDGKIAASLTGRDENLMRPGLFDVARSRGKKARLQVVDDDSGGWGNISLDHVVFSDLQVAPGSPDRAAFAAAKAANLDPGRLVRWVKVLMADVPRTAPLAPRDSVVFEDFDKSSYENWSVSGQAFGKSPTAPGSSRIEGDGPVPAPPGLAHSGLVSDRLEGVLRSKTFAIEHKFIHVLAHGKSGRINVVVDGFEKIRDPIYGGLLHNIDSPAPRWFTLDVTMWKGHRAYLELGDGATLDYSGANTRRMPGEGFLAVDEIRFSDGPAPPMSPPPGLAKLEGHLRRIQSGKFGDGPEDASLARLLLVNRLVDLPAELGPMLARYREIEGSIPTPTLALAIIDGTGENEHILIRGSGKSPGEEVSRRFLEVVAGADQSAPSPGSGRLELARKMLDPSCALTARVMVNRIWKGHFGAGLVKTPDDFGIMGEAPSHPELLDWLASEFVAKGWSIKAMHREMMLSKAYRMASGLEPAAEAIDGANRLLHRMNVRRLEAEAVRDSMLAISARLDRTMGGPGIATHLTPLMEGRGRPGASGPLDGDGRRSVYLNIRRNFLPPMLLAFDFPAPASTMGRRNVSNVPAQALTMLDDPFVIGQAKLWADRLLELPAKTTVERVDRAFLAAFGRTATAEEQEEAANFLSSFGDDPRRAWADFCHALFNAKEFLFIP